MVSWETSDGKYNGETRESKVDIVSSLRAVDIADISYIINTFSFSHMKIEEPARMVYRSYPLEGPAQCLLRQFSTCSGSCSSDGYS